jgi:hypothetical protein
MVLFCVYSSVSLLSGWMQYVCAFFDQERKEFELKCVREQGAMREQLQVHTTVEAAEERTAHNNGWSEWNGIKHIETMCLMYLIPFCSRLLTRARSPQLRCHRPPVTHILWHLLLIHLKTFKSNFLISLCISRYVLCICLKSPYTMCCSLFTQGCTHWHTEQNVFSSFQVKQSFDLIDDGDDAVQWHQLNDSM